MSDLLAVLKQAATDAYKAGNPMAVIFGEVRNIKPLEVIVDQRFTLTAAFLIVPESLVHYEIDLRHDHKYIDTSDSGTTNRTTEPALPDKPIVIRRGLEVGDKVLLLRVQGGQQYVILDRVVDNDT